MGNPTLILVKYTTRGRKERFFDGMDSIYNLCSRPDFIRTIITADEDDLEMNNDEVKERIKLYPNSHIVYGVSTGKINAINRDFDKLPDDFKDWKIIANFSDDQRFSIYAWDDYIRADFNTVFPEKFDGYMAYLDTDTHSALSTLYIAGRAWFDKFGWVYDPQFISLFCDVLMEDVAKKLGKYHYTGYTIYKHLCPSYGHLSEDKQFRDQQDIGWDIDNKLYYKIKEEGLEKYLQSLGIIA